MQIIVATIHGESYGPFSTALPDITINYIASASAMFRCDLSDVSREEAVLDVGRDDARGYRNT